MTRSKQNKKAGLQYIEGITCAFNPSAIAKYIALKAPISKKAAIRIGFIMEELAFETRLSAASARDVLSPDDVSEHRIDTEHLTAATVFDGVQDGDATVNGIKEFSRVLGLGPVIAGRSKRMHNAMEMRNMLRSERAERKSMNDERKRIAEARKQVVAQ